MTERQHTEDHPHHLREEIDHLREVARTGDSAETPAIALGEVILFLIPVIAIILGAAFAAYYLA